MLTVTGSSLKQRMCGMVLSYLAVTSTRITHYVFVSKEQQGVKNGAILSGLTPKTSLACNKLFL